MLTVLGGLAEFERELIRARTGEGRARRRGERRPAGPQADLHPSPEARGNQACEGGQGYAGPNCALLQCEPLDDFEARDLKKA